MQYFRLINEQVRQRAIEAVRSAPEGYAVRVGSPPRTLEQNALLHALLTEIAETKEWAGKQWDVETWKRLLIAAWSRADGRAIPVVPALDGQGVDLVYAPSSSLTKAEMVSLIDFVQAWQAGGAA
jgi:hypothetical protein